MNTAQILALFAAATELIEAIIPALRDALAGGVVSAERQLAIRAKVDLLREKLEAGDLGDHWKIDS